MVSPSDLARLGRGPHDAARLAQVAAAQPPEEAGLLESVARVTEALLRIRPWHRSSENRLVAFLAAQSRFEQEGWRVPDADALAEVVAIADERRLSADQIEELLASVAFPPA